MIAATTGLGIRATAVNADCRAAGALDHVGVGHVGHLLDVGAGREDPLAAVDDDRLDVVAVGRLGRGGPDLLLDLHVERVHLRPVEPDRADAVGDLEPYELALCRHPRRSRSRAIGRSRHSASIGNNGAGDPRTLAQPRRDARPCGRGATGRSASTWSAGGDELRRLRPARRPPRWVCLFDDDGGETRHRLTEQSLGIWHGAIPGVAAGTRYGYRVDGPWEPEQGLRFNPAQAAARPLRAGDQRRADRRPGDLRLRRRRARRARARRLRAVRARERGRRTTGSTGAATRRCGTRWRDTVIYELHVKGMTALHDRVPEELRGTYAGLATPAVIDYLRDLGVTAVELLPVHQFCTEPALARARAWSTTGATTRSASSPRTRLLRLRRPRRAGHRVQADGQGVPRRPGSRSSSTWSTTTPPRPAPTGRRCPSAGSTTAASTTGSTTAKPGAAVRRHLLGRHRLRQHRRRLATRSRCG